MIMEGDYILICRAQVVCHQLITHCSLLSCQLPKATLFDTQGRFAAYLLTFFHSDPVFYFPHYQSTSSTGSGLRYVPPSAYSQLLRHPQEVTLLFKSANLNFLYFSTFLRQPLEVTLLFNSTDIFFSISQGILVTDDV